MTADSNSRNIRYPSQLAILLALTGAGLIIGGFVSVGIWMMMTNRSVLTIETDMMNPAFYNAVMVMQAVSTLFIFFLPAYFFAMICYRKPSKYLGYNVHFNYRQILLMIGILILTFPLSGALANLNNILPIPHNWAIKFKTMETTRAAQEAALIQVNSFSRYLISLFIIAFLPALLEETFFRAGLQNLLTRWFKRPWIAIVLTGIIFSLVHLSYYGFLVRFALGVILGYIFYYSGSVWLNILCHFLFNGIQVTALYVMTVKGIKDSNDIGSNFPLWAGLIALLLLLYLFTLFKRTSEIEKAKYIGDDRADDDLSWINN